MDLNEPKDITRCADFFLNPGGSRHRMYEALRAYFVEGCSTEEVSKRFGYSEGSFRVMCHHFRREEKPEFFVALPRGPKLQPKKAATSELIIKLRKENHSVYEISDALKEQGSPLSPTAVREVLKEEGFGPLPRRLDEERPQRPRPTVEEVADVRAFGLVPGSYPTQCGGLFLFLPELVALDLDGLAKTAELPGSRMIPSGHALRTCVALKLWCVERFSHVMSLVADPGLALFAGLNAVPKRSYLAEYSSQVDPRSIPTMLSAWDTRMVGSKTLPGESFNLDFHSVPYYGEHPIVEKHYVSARSRAQKSILAFMAQDASSHAFCYSNTDIRKGEEANEVLKFIDFWKETRKELPKHIVFDSRLTTYKTLDQIDETGILFMTLRRRTRKLLDEISLLPKSAWRTIELDVPGRKYRTPKVYENKVTLVAKEYRQLYIRDLGHDEPTILITNDKATGLAKLVTRYAKRMLIENALSDAVRFFHIDALSSSVCLKIDFDMALMVICSAIYRRLAQAMRGYSDAQARQVFRDIINIPADIVVQPNEVCVRLHRRAHLPIIQASGILDSQVSIPWWNGATLRFKA